MDDQEFYANGIDGKTGFYLESPRGVDEARAGIEIEKDPRLEALAKQLKEGVHGLPADVSASDLAQAGWAVVAHKDEAEMIRTALQPLIEHRRSTLSEKFLIYDGQSRPKWLAQRGVANSNVNPAKIPYYLLLAGSTSNMPFRFAHDLAVDYAVGRLEFDTPAEYRAYAEQLVAYETSKPRARHLAFFGPRHDFDAATRLSADHLLTPLAQRFSSTADIGAAATKSRFGEILRGNDDVRPTILFTASHGVAFGPDDPRQRARQGALVCQDWRQLGVISEEHYFAAEDIPTDANVDGLLSFHFACFGAGTPERDRFYKREGGPPKKLADQPFIATLPKEFLKRGALAVVGHVDRAWGFSIVSPGAGPQIQAFENFLSYVSKGERVGHAMRDFADLYAIAAVELTGEIERSEGEDVPARTLMNLWIQRNDAQAYMVIGDPAVRLS